MAKQREKNHGMLHVYLDVFNNTHTMPYVREYRANHNLKMSAAIMRLVRKGLTCMGYISPCKDREHKG